MTDKELLELAAKAAGYPVEFDCEVNGWYAYGERENGDVDEWWNPLTDDGDALRLAVKLHIRLEFTAPADKPNWTAIASTRNRVYATERSEDLNSATRRAIVRAAAEIGKEMK